MDVRGGVAFAHNETEQKNTQPSNVFDSGLTGKSHLGVAITSTKPFAEAFAALTI